MRALGTVLPLDNLDLAATRLTRLIKAFALSTDNFDWHTLYIDLSREDGSQELNIQMLMKEVH